MISCRFQISWVFSALSLDKSASIFVGSALDWGGCKAWASWAFVACNSLVKSAWLTCNVCISCVNSVLALRAWASWAFVAFNSLVKSAWLACNVFTFCVSSVLAWRAWVS